MAFVSCAAVLLLRKRRNAVLAAMVEHLVVEFSEDQLEYLFEHIDAGVCEDLVLHFDDQIAQ